MVYYLVNQTLIIEADSENQAAEKVIERTLKAQQLEYKVKLDEGTSWHVSITAERRDEIVRTASLNGRPQTSSKPLKVGEDLDGRQIPELVTIRRAPFSGRLVIPGALMVLSVLLVANLVAVIYI